MSWAEQRHGNGRDSHESDIGQWDEAVVPLGPRRRRRPGSDETGDAEDVGATEGALKPDRVEKQMELSRSICLRLLADRPRTRAELTAILAKKGVPAEVADAVLERFSEVGLIDDAAFAKAWVSSRHHSRGLARRALGQELRHKGVDSELIGEALGELDPDTEVETARALVARKMRTVSGPTESVIRKLVGMLARKGYSPGLAFRVVKEAMEQADHDAAELLDLENFVDHDRDALP